MLATTGAKEEEVNYFLSPMCLGILHIFADLKGVFVNDFLRKLDCDDSLLIDVYRVSEEFVESMSAFNTSAFDLFLSGLEEDEFENVLYKQDEHSIILNYTHHQSRHATQTKIKRIEDELNFE